MKMVNRVSLETVVNAARLKGLFVERNRDEIRIYARGVLRSTSSDFGVSHERLTEIPKYTALSVREAYAFVLGYNAGVEDASESASYLNGDFCGYSSSLDYSSQVAITTRRVNFGYEHLV